MSSTLTSRKEISLWEKELVNLIVGCRLFKYVMNLFNRSSPCVQRRNMSSMKRHQIRGECEASARAFSSNFPMKRLA